MIGGGWAGCAAAVTLAREGFPVTLFEQAQTLGGRARRVVVDGTVVDNGQHLLVGAYRQSLALVEQLHGRDRAAAKFRRLPLTLQPFGAGSAGALAIAAWRLPSPFHLLGALLNARGLTWGERVALLASFHALAQRDFACPADQTVAEMFAGTPRAIVAGMWEPLCLAALNTPLEHASAQVFARVLREAFTGPACNSDFLVPVADLSACFPDAAGRDINERSGQVRTGVTVRAIDGGASGVAVRTARAMDDIAAEDFAAAIIAVGPHQLRHALGPATAEQEAWHAPLAQVDAFRYEPITTIYLRLAAPLPMQAPLLRLDDRPGQWIFLHGRRTAESPVGDPLYAVVISAGPVEAIAPPTLVAAVEQQLRRLLPDFPAVTWSRVISERRATYACTANLARPRAGRIAPRLYLAGDYTDPDLPATLEAAARSGVAAANALIDDTRQRNAP